MKDSVGGMKGQTIPQPRTKGNLRRESAAPWQLGSEPGLRLGKGLWMAVMREEPDRRRGPMGKERLDEKKPASSGGSKSLERAFCLTV